MAEPKNHEFRFKATKSQKDFAEGIYNLSDEFLKKNIFFSSVFLFGLDMIRQRLKEESSAEVSKFLMNYLASLNKLKGR